MRLSIIPFACFCGSHLVAGPSQGTPSMPTQSPLGAFSFLVGQWQASGAGDPGRSIGESSFEWAADRHALLRHNVAMTSAGRHTDIMLVYARPDSTVHAVYVDNEGHAIDCDATVVSDQHRVVFESKAPGPRFRLWYQAHEDGSLATGFQVAQPGSSDFKTYREGVACREQPAPNIVLRS